VSIVYFDLVGGASGDMILGSLVALGAPLPEIERRLRALPLEGIALRSTIVQRHGFDALQLEVKTEETTSHRHFTAIRRMLEDGHLPPRVLRRSLGAFELLARC